jgi:acetylornithine/succinyldiaminopimelate/putrescine aminotransferase
MMDQRLEVKPEMFPGSTFAGNPLACSAIVATLKLLKEMPLEKIVKKISNTIVHHLGWLNQTSIALRGKGALWVIELPNAIDTKSLVKSIYDSGVCVGFSGRQFRIMPAVTIQEDNLNKACEVVSNKLKEALLKASA